MSNPWKRKNWGVSRFSQGRKGQESFQINSGVSMTIMPREEDEFLHFTTPQRIERELHLLQGVLNGIAIDRKLNDKEVAAIFDWCGTRDKLLDIAPFCDVRDELIQIGTGRELSHEQREDLLWFCLRYKTDNEYYDELTSEVQRLHGVLAGVAADGIITHEELTRLRGWLAAHNHLRTMWPFDEIDTIVTAVLLDGCIDEQEHSALLSFCGQFTGTGSGQAVGKSMVLSGVCATDPEILFHGRLFCFTGKPSPPNSKRQFAEMVIDLGGDVHGHLTRKTDYLVVGAGGSECWAFSCYGRKVEAAMASRRDGLPIQIVHEFDFLDATRDAIK
jgi:hypothetical protein